MGAVILSYWKLILDLDNVHYLDDLRKIAARGKLLHEPRGFRKQKGLCCAGL